MYRGYSRILFPAFFLAALTTSNIGAAGIGPYGTGVVDAASHSGGAPTVTIDGGRVRGFTLSSGYLFRGLPYAAAPTIILRNHDMATSLCGDEQDARCISPSFRPIRISSFQFNYAFPAIGANFSGLHDIVCGAAGRLRFAPPAMGRRNINSPVVEGF